MTTRLSVFSFLLLTVALVVLLIFFTSPATAVTGNNEADLMDRIRKYFPDFDPKAIVDVGANKGAWSEATRHVFPNASLLLLEATPDKDELLKSVAQEIGNAQHRIKVLSDTAGQEIQFFQGGDTGNSMFQENTVFYRNDKPVTYISSTLDGEIANSFLKDKSIDIIKVDVQGAELLVFQGGLRALAQATFVTFEASTIEYNKGSPCTYDVDAFLRKQGYFLMEIGELWRHPGLFKTPAVGQYDVLYVRPSSPKLPSKLKNTQFCGANSAVADESITVEEILQTVERTVHRDPLTFLLGVVVGAMASVSFARMMRVRQKTN